MTYSLLLAKGGLFDPIAKPLAAVLAFFYSLVPNYGVAIVLLTIAMMIVLTPLTIKQTRSMLVMQKLQPEMKKLQDLHKNDRQALNEAVMALYKEHNASPLGGCLPMLLPFPLFIGLLRVLEGLSHTVTTTVAGHKVTTAVPKYLSIHTRMYQDIVKAHGQLDAFGMNLAKSARTAGGGFAHSLPYFVLLLLMVGTQFYQQYQLTSKNPAAKSQPGQAMMMKFIPLFFGLISLQFPAGVVLYWTVSNMIRVGQQWALYRYDPKVKALVAKDVKEIEAKTREIEAKDKPPPGRSRFRDLLSNAAEAAADRRGQGGKSAASPRKQAPGDKGRPAGRGSPNQQGKASTGTPGGGKSQAGSKSSGSQKPGAPRAGTPKAGTAKGAPAKASGAQPGGPKASGASAGSPKTSGAQPGGPKASGAPAGSPKSSSAQPGGPKASGGRPGPGGGPRSTKPPVPGKATPAVPAATAKPTTGAKPNGTNGATAKETAVPPATNGVGAPTGANGSGVDSRDGADEVEAATPTGNKAPVKGRTGGGSARHVSTHRRRKGK